jgi:hypothetical protein
MAVLSNIVTASHQDSLAPSMALALRASHRDVPNGYPAVLSNDRFSSDRVL